MKEWKNKNPEKYKSYNETHALRMTLSKHGIPWSDWGKILADSMEVCAICEEPFVRIAIDHDHETGIVRGLLCFSCNSGLGFLQTLWKNSLML